MTLFQGRQGRCARRARPVAWGLVGTALLLLGVLASGAGAQEAAPEPIPYGRLTVDGSARRSVVPDQATIDFGVRQEATSAQAAFDSAQFILSNIVVALRANDVPEEAMRSTGLNLRPVYRYDQGEPELVGYAAEGSVRVETRNLRGLGNLIDAAVAAGADRIENLQYGYSDEQAVRAELLDQAASQAREKAERIARALGQQVKGVAQVHEVAGGAVPLARVAQMEAADAGTVVLPGTLTVEARIQVEFILAPEKPESTAPALPEVPPPAADREAPPGED